MLHFAAFMHAGESVQSRGKVKEVKKERRRQEPSLLRRVSDPHDVRPNVFS